ncbi:zinc finger MYM-type protein 1-like, partial [Aphis craccivora]
LSEILKKRNSSKSHLIFVSKLALMYYHNCFLLIKKKLILYLSHDEETDSLNQGNCKELTKIFVKSVPGFQNIHNQHVNYTSWKIQDEIIQLCSDEINEIIVNEVSSVRFFVLMCDES